MSETVIVQKSTPVLGIIAVLFVIAKLTGIIDWSWYVIFAPIWVPLCISLFVLLLVFVVCPLIVLIVTFCVVLISDWIDKRRREKRRKIK